MKTKTIITGITHDDLVTLFSTATYGSEYLGIEYKKEDYYGTNLEEEGDCMEDVWAKILLAGKSVEVVDYYAEGDKYGNLPCTFDEDENAHYTITLKDIEKGIEKALDKEGWERKCATHLIEEESLEFDLYEAEALLQMITFGEVIYG